MNKNRDLIIVGIVMATMTFVLPVLDGCGTSVCAWLHKKTAKFQIDSDVFTAEAQNYVNGLGDKDSGSSHAIGFDIGSPSIDEYEEEEE